MFATTKKSKQKKQTADTLRVKAKLFDEVVALIEEKYLSELMRKTEKESNISLTKAKKLLA